MKWTVVLRDYDRWHCRANERVIVWFQNQPSLRAAIEVAAQATDEGGRRYSHQRRIQRQAIEHATVALLAVERSVARTKSFDELLALLTGQLREVFGVGELYCYDTAFRIGARLGLFPTRVHLHAGTRVGARALGLPHWKDTLEMSEMPSGLRHRKPHELEDILCIYKGSFHADETSKTTCGPAASRRRMRC